MDVYRIGPFQLDPARLITTCGGKPLPFGPKVTETLLALAERAGRAVSKSDLLDRIWPDGFVEEANLSQNVYVLRKAFRRHGFPDAIQTVARVGYRLAAPVSTVTTMQRTPSTLSGIVRRAIAVGVAAATLAATLLTTASGGLGERSAAPRPLSAAGARLYALGTYFWNQRTRDGVNKSLAYFDQVVDADPSNPRGYAALAAANITLGAYCFGKGSPSVYFARARAYAEQALALDRESPEAHAVLGELALQGSDPSAALPELQLAIGIDPAYAPAQEWYGIALVEAGRLSDGIAHLKTASALDPLSVATTAWLGIAAYQAHRFDESIAYGKQALELSPQRADVLTTIGKAYEARGDLALAIEAFKQFSEANPYHQPEGAALLARAYALEHRTSEARTLYSSARAHAMSVDSTDLAAAADALGDRRAAQDILRHARGRMLVPA